MQDVCEPFRGKKITLMGLGLLGRGVGDTEFLAECGADVLVTDKKTEAELVDSVARLRKYPSITFHLGGHQKEDFTNCDLVIKAAGVRLNSPEIAAARAAGVSVVMSTALFAKYGMGTGAKIIGITGTRGKSTVAHMIHHSLIRANKRTVLGGNIRGISTLAMLLEIKAGDIAVLELDSWQLQGFGDLKISPHVAVFTNLMPDHQNYYPDMEAYFADKANIFRFQKQGDALFIGGEIAEKIQAARPPAVAVVPPAIPSEWRLKISGEHNRQNASFAAATLRVLGLSNGEIKEGLESFDAVEGRLQLVRDINSIKIYNDNNATTPEAAIAALRALGTNVVLIMGGADKNLDMTELLAEIAKRCKKVFLLAGTGTERFRSELPEAPVFPNLQDAFDAAVKSAASGDSILFSPAFASFGMFKNEYDRNDQFLQIVRKMGASA